MTLPIEALRAQLVESIAARAMPWVRRTEAEQRPVIRRLSRAAWKSVQIAARWVKRSTDTERHVAEGREPAYYTRQARRHVALAEAGRDAVRALGWETAKLDAAIAAVTEALAR